MADRPQNPLDHPVHDPPAGEDDLNREPVEVLADEFVERHRSGESPSIEEYAAKYPDLADEIRDLFPTIASLEHLKLKREHSSDGRAATGLPCLKQLGDFRIVREIGRGGMGIVYEAEQLSLRRLVALKVLGAQIANSAKQLKRFRREAEAAARLHHTNIVPIFAIGEEDGVRYYAMQYIDGPTLSDLIEQASSGNGRRDATRPDSIAAGRDRSAHWGHPAGDGPERPAPPLTETVGDSSSTDSRFESPPVVQFKEASDGDGPPQVFVSPPSRLLRNQHDLFRRRDWRGIARIAAELADALAYAHDQGVLHRDIKPSNVLLDNAGMPWLADFGLAKHEDHDGVTNSGDIVGTLRFMAPEQFQGRTDSRSDIYSLGLTLYEMLTLRPAFEESRHGPLVQAKVNHSPPSPRSVTPGIPRDLETITLKACATEPRHRYQSAKELADDLRRYLADIPIRARPVTPLEQLWRWARRNPLIAFLSTTTAALLVAVAFVFAVGKYRTQLAFDRAESERRNAVAERDRAEEEAQRAEDNLELSLAVVDDIIKNISSRGMPSSLDVDLDDPENSGPYQYVTVTAADARLLEMLVSFFDQFAQRNEANLRHQSADAYRRIGDIRQRLGQLDKAEASYRNALLLVHELQLEAPNDPELKVQEGQLWNSIGIVRSVRGDIRDSWQAHLTADHVLEEAVKVAEGETGDLAKFELAQTYILLSSVWERSGTNELLSNAFDAHHRSRGEDADDAREDDSPDAGRGSDRFTSRRPPPDEHSGEAGRGFRPGSPGPSPQAQPRNGFRGPRKGAPPPERSPRRRLDYRRLFADSITLLRELIAKHPDRPEYRLALARSYRNRARQSRGDGEARHEAEYSGMESIDILQRLVDEYPNDPSFKYELADTKCLVAQRLRECPIEDRLDWLNETVTICDELLTAYPRIPEYQALKANALRGLAQLERDELKQYADAESHFNTALDLQRQLAERFPSIRLYVFSRAQTLSELADMQNDMGQRGQARQTMRLAIAAIEKSMKSQPDDRGHEMFLERLRRQQLRYFDHPAPPAKGNGPREDVATDEPGEVELQSPAPQ